MKLLQDNDLHGLLYLSSLKNRSTQSKDDVLHLNDVEPFPLEMAEGFFKRGDLLISLRNINTVLVFSSIDMKIRWHRTGTFVRQHDPDFVDGDTLSVFDNQNFESAGGSRSSRVLLLSAPDFFPRVHFRGDADHPFFTRIMGKHQWLPNGNVLVLESTRGRVLEVVSEGRILWEYVNFAAKGLTGIVGDAHRLPPHVAELFSRDQKVLEDES